jgi:sec-independent protein translocase protein TatA
VAPNWIIILVVVLVLFGGSQLPKLAKNLGKAQKEFKDGMAEANSAATMPARRRLRPPPRRPRHRRPAK